MLCVKLDGNLVTPFEDYSRKWLTFVDTVYIHQISIHSVYTCRHLSSTLVADKYRRQKFVSAPVKQITPSGLVLGLRKPGLFWTRVLYRVLYRVLEYATKPQVDDK